MGGRLLLKYQRTKLIFQSFDFSFFENKTYIYNIYININIYNILSCKMLQFIFPKDKQMNGGILCRDFSDWSFKFRSEYSRAR